MAVDPSYSGDRETAMGLAGPSLAKVLMKLMVPAIRSR